MNERILFIKLDPKTEGDVISWIKSLPPRTVNKTVNEIVVAESRGQTARIPYKFSSTNAVEPLRCRLIFRSKAALNFLSKIPKGEYKATLVEIIRRHIEKNKCLPPVTFEINIKYLSVAIDRFVKAIKNKRWESKGVPHRFDKLNSFYEHAFKDFSNAVLNCYKSADRNHGDYNLYHLDTEDIVNKAFASVFGEITVTANKSVDENSVKAPAEVANKNLVRIKNKSNQASERTALIAADYSKNAFTDNTVPQRARSVKNNISEDTDIMRVFGTSKSINENLIKEADDATSGHADENQEDVLLKILEYGIPDEELAIICEKLKESRNEVKINEE